MEDPGKPDFVGRSHGMRRLKSALLHLPAPQRLAIVRGEPGSGRERVARWLHRAWWPKGSPLVIDCSLPSEVLRSWFEQASNESRRRPSTLILRSPHELEPQQRSRLGNVASDLDVGMESGWTLVVIDAPEHQAATVEALGRIAYRFRDAAILHVPPLRERRMDLAGLVRVLLDELCDEEAAERNLISADALDGLARYRWPGNIPELRSALERARLAAGRDRIELQHLPREIRRPLQSDDAVADASLAEVERAHILATLQRYGGKRGDTAAALGIHVNTLGKKLAEYGVGRRRRPRGPPKRPTC